MMERWTLPPGWEWRTLSEVSRINPPRPRLERDDTEMTSFVPMQAVDEIEGKIAVMQTRPFGEIKRGYTYFEEGDVLMAKITPSMENGKAAIARGLLGGFGFGTTEFHVFRPNVGVAPEWLFHFIRRHSFRMEARSNFRGAVGQQRVPEDFLVTYPIPIPYPDDPPRSLAEQRRIVARLEALLGEVRELRQLQAEIEADVGRLMEAVIQEVFDQRNGNWQTTALHEVAAIQTGTAKGRHFGGRKTVEVPYLRVANVQAGFLNLEEVKTIAIAEDEFERYRLQPGDLLLTEGGDHDKLGRGAVWDGQIKPCIHQNHIFAVRFDQARVLPRFAEYEMQSWHAKSYFLGVAKKTTNLATINRTKLGNFPLLLPPLPEQRRIVAELDAAKAEIAQMIETQSASVAMIEPLEQSILAQAFRGELLS